MSTALMTIEYEDEYVRELILMAFNICMRPIRKDVILDINRKTQHVKDADLREKLRKRVKETMLPGLNDFVWNKLMSEPQAAEGIRLMKDALKGLPKDVLKDIKDMIEPVMEWALENELKEVNPFRRYVSYDILEDVIRDKTVEYIQHFEGRLLLAQAN